VSETIREAATRRRVVIESPYKGDIDANIEFAKKACRFAVDRGYSPFAMHLLFPQFLNDNDPRERELGIGCGLAWSAAADEVWFCLREGEVMTSGMAIAKDAWDERRVEQPSLVIRFLRFDRAGLYVRGFGD
jgi:hypothetical protein